VFYKRRSQWNKNWANIRNFFWKKPSPNTHLVVQVGLDDAVDVGRRRAMESQHFVARDVAKLHNFMKLNYGHFYPQVLDIQNQQIQVYLYYEHKSSV
jgi:hypothetical protein